MSEPTAGLSGRDETPWWAQDDPRTGASGHTDSAQPHHDRDCSGCPICAVKNMTSAERAAALGHLSAAASELMLAARVIADRFAGTDATSGTPADQGQAEPKTSGQSFATDAAEAAAPLLRLVREHLSPDQQGNAPHTNDNASKDG